MDTERLDYKVTQKISLKLFKDYCKTVNKQGYAKKRKDAIMTGFAMIIIGVMTWFIPLKPATVFFVCLGLLYWFFPNVYWNKHVKDRYVRHKSLSEGEQKLHFYEDHFTVRWGKEKNTFSYQDLAKVIDTKEAWYFMVNEKDGQIVDKKSCDEDTTTFLTELASKYSH